MSAGPLPWARVFERGTPVMLIVNSAAAQADEIERALAALDSSCGLEHVSCIAPVTLKRRLIHRGIEAGSILVPRVAGLEVEFGDFLERPHTVHWAVRRAAGLVLGTEPYAPGNEEAKFDFERRVAPMLGGARFVVHSLPRDEVFVLGAEELWNRAALDDSKAMHRARVATAVERLHARWSAGATPAEAADTAATALGSGERPGDDAARRVAARQYALERLWGAVRAGHHQIEAGLPRLLVQPAGSLPRAGWLPGAIEAVRRPVQIGKGVRWRSTRLVVRGEVEGPYTYLVMSRPVNLERGDAVIAEGRVYRGGVTIGLVSQDAWASKVDVDAPGPFLAAAVATEPGPHALVIANCLKGDERNTAVVLRRFGWARA